MAIVPDDKDWTWVLERPCPECGFEPTTFEPPETGATVRDLAARWASVLTRPDAGVRARSDRWSPLEYGCHVRDVFRLYDERLLLMLSVDDPLYANWDQDETAIADRYGQQDPAVVARQLVEAAATVAQRFDGVAGDQWRRTGRRSDGAAFTVDSFARYFVHDPVHHLWDVRG
jgi:hypothetical protein